MMKRKKIVFLLAWLIVGISWFTLLPKKILAAAPSCQSLDINLQVRPGIAGQGNNFTLTFDPAAAQGKINLDREKTLCLSCPTIFRRDKCFSIGIPSDKQYRIEFSQAGDQCSVQGVGQHYFVIKDGGTKECEQKGGYVMHFPPCITTLETTGYAVGPQTLKARFFGWGNFAHTGDINAALIKDGSVKTTPQIPQREKEGDDLVVEIQADFNQPGQYSIALRKANILNPKIICQTESIYIGVGLTITPAPTLPPGVTPTIPPPPGAPDKYLACGDPSDPNYGRCRKCIDDGDAWTALDCIPTDPAKFVAWVLSFAIKIGGGIAFLLMLWGGFQIMTSSGDPEKLNQGKSIITSAISGLILIIFSVLLLKVIGVDIFQLPGWGK